MRKKKVRKASAFVMYYNFVVKSLVTHRVLGVPFTAVKPNHLSFHLRQLIKIYVDYAERVELCIVPFVTFDEAFQAASEFYKSNENL